MKKLLFAATLMLAISGMSIAQTAPAKSDKAGKKMDSKMDSKMAKSDSSKTTTHAKKWDKKSK